MKTSKRTVVYFAMFMLFCFVFVPVVNADATPAVNSNASEHVQSDAQILAGIGMLKGEGGGVTQQYLSQPTTRIQAAIMFLRLKGFESTAIQFAGMDNFSDAMLVNTTNQHIMAYLKAHPEDGWVGSGDGKFDPLAKITVQQYYKVMLTTLGYQQNTDFTYDQVLTFGKNKGLSLLDNMTMMPFKNADVATATVEALNANLKGKGVTLAQSMSSGHAINSTVLTELNAPSLTIMQKSSMGMGYYLADSKGNTLYYFTKNTGDIHACQGACLKVWPLYYQANLRVPAQLNASDFGAVTLSDGSKQTTYKGWPLYTFANDSKPGDINGDGFKNVWYTINVPQYTVMIGTQTDLGNYLTDSSGKTLYYFANDTNNMSNCSGTCIQNWPAFYSENIVVPSGLKAEDFGSITRTDGSKQTTYKGRPLYYFVNDKAFGDANGQGLKNIWYAQKVDTSAMATGSGM